MVRYATGRHAQAICDKCGLSYPYLSLQAEWNGLRTCPECWDAKHPALDPRTAFDPEALHYARPGNNKREDARAVIISGLAISTTTGYMDRTTFRVDSIIPASTTGSVSCTVSLSNETPTAADPITGIAVTTSVGTESIRRTGWGNGGWGTDNWGHD